MSINHSPAATVGLSRRGLDRVRLERMEGVMQHKSTNNRDHRSASSSASDFHASLII